METPHTALKSVEKRRVWAERLADWQASGLSQQEYCRQHGLKLCGFAYWRRRLRNPDPAPSFVPVRLDDSLSPPWPPEGAALRLVTVQGHRLEIGAGFDPGTLAEVLRVLARIPC